MKISDFLKKSRMIMPVLIVFLLSLAYCGLSASAADAGDLEYEINSGRLFISGYNGNEKDVRLPGYVYNRKIIGIAEGTFTGDNDIVSVYIPETISYIDPGAFDSDRDITIRCEKGSYAHKFAQLGNIPVKLVRDKKPTAVSLGSKKLSAAVGEKLTLTAKLTPSDTLYDRLSWSSSDKKKATVKNGVVSLLSPGTVKVTARTENGKTAVCTISIKQKAKKIVLDKKSVTLGKGESFTLTATVKPDNTTDKKLNWKSSNKAVVTVKNGRLKALKEGSADITVTQADKKSAVCRVTVKAKPEKIWFAEKELIIGAGESITLSSKVNKGSACSKRTYFSSKPSVAAVKGTTLTAKKEGSCFVRVRAYNGKVGKVKLTILAAPTKIKFGRKEVTLVVGEKYKLGSFINKKQASYLRDYSTFSPEIACFEENNKNGVIIAMSEGTTDAVVRTYNGKMAHCTINVVKSSIRKEFVDNAISYLGCHEADGSHQPIIDIYNSDLPLPLDFHMTYKSAWCAAYVSAMAIKTGIKDIVYKECGCERMIKLYKDKGQWVEDDAYVPERGDLIFYCWDDDGKGDCKKPASHVGIVVDVNNGVMKIIEGNKGKKPHKDDKVGYRMVKINDKEIRGFATPDFPS